MLQCNFTFVSPAYHATHPVSVTLCGGGGGGGCVRACVFVQCRQTGAGGSIKKIRYRV